MTLALACVCVCVRVCVHVRVRVRVRVGVCVCVHVRVVCVQDALPNLEIFTWAGGESHHEAAGDYGHLATIFQKAKRHLHHPRLWNVKVQAMLAQPTIRRHLGHLCGCDERCWVDGLRPHMFLRQIWLTSAAARHVWWGPDFRHLICVMWHVCWRE